MVVRLWSRVLVVLAVLLVACLSVSVASTDDDLDVGALSVTVHGAAPIVARAHRIILTFGLSLILLLAMALQLFVALLPRVPREPVPILLPWDHPSSSVLDSPRL